MIVLGVDPDLHETALAICDERRVYAVHVVRPCDQSLIEEEAVRAMCSAIATELPALIDLVVYPVPGGRPENIGMPWHGVVEGQSYYTGQKSKNGKANPEDLIRLACVSGAALSAMASRGIRADDTRMPPPWEWKGQLAKHIPQERAWQHYGYGVGYRGTGAKTHAFPKGRVSGPFNADPILGADEVKPGQWLHVSDAVALALWGATRAWKPKFVKKEFPP